ncbi:hypothetical protein MIR68_002262 [Amoeboaphelidium protococcarum]|nr:hypothetical protein MIR68_002262 [Amoeboaphelidium protococcarum]
MSALKTNLHQKAIAEVTVIQDPALNQHQTLAPAPLSITKSQIVVKQQQQQNNQHNLSPTSPLNSSSINYSPSTGEKDSIEEAYQRFVKQRQEAMDRLERERQELKQRLQQKRGLNMLTPSKVDISRQSPSNQQDTATTNNNNNSNNNGDGFSRSGAQSTGNRGRSDQRNQQNLDYREFEQGLPPRNPWDIEENDFDQLKQIYK